MSRELIDGFLALAEQAGLAARRDAMFAGEIVNPTEGRAAEHVAERGQGAPESVARAAGLHARMRALIDAIEAEAFGPVRHILHLGIGGSALGPEAADRRAWPRKAGALRRRRWSRTSTAPALEEAIAGFDPHATLVVIASKTFTTTETMLNAALGAALAGGGAASTIPTAG